MSAIQKPAQSLDLLSIKEVCAMLRISRPLLNDLMNKREIEFYRLSTGAVRIPSNAITAFLDKARYAPDTRERHKPRGRPRKNALVPTAKKAKRETPLAAVIDDDEV